MSDSEYERAREIVESRQATMKFGTDNPSLNSVCQICGRRYGEHYGLECPTEEE